MQRAIPSIQTWWRCVLFKMLKGLLAAALRQVCRYTNVGQLLAKWAVMGYFGYEGEKDEGGGACFDGRKKLTYGW